MDEEPAQKVETTKQESEFPVRHRFSWGWLTWAFIILVVYVLSIGPAFRFMMRGHSPLATIVAVIYTPLFDLGTVLPPFRVFLFWYLGVWGWHPVFA